MSLIVALVSYMAANSRKRHRQLLLMIHAVTVSKYYFKLHYHCNCDREVKGSANDGEWHHICFTWQSSDGALRFYKDGRLHMNSTGLKTGYTMKGGGSLVLGQDQDAVAGGFDASQSFQGSLTNVNVWSYVLSANAIKNLSKSWLSGVGNMYKWTDFIHGVKGKTRVVIPSPCYPLSSRG